jgi:hypothetical protein
MLGYDPMNLTEAGLSKGRTPTDKLDDNYSMDRVARVFKGLAGWDDESMKEEFARNKIDEIIPSQWKAVKLGEYQINIPNLAQATNYIPGVAPTKSVIDNLTSFEKRQA